MKGPGNSKRELKGLRRGLNKVEGSNWPPWTTYHEYRPDGHVNPFMDLEIIVIGNSYPAASPL
jgi:hypothetical protein